MAREFEEETGIKTNPSHWHELALIQGIDFNCWFFKYYSVNDMEYYSYKSITNEEVFSVPVQHLGTANCIPNLKWLIPLALDWQPTLRRHILDR